MCMLIVSLKVVTGSLLCLLAALLAYSKSSQRALSMLESGYVHVSLDVVWAGPAIAFTSASKLLFLQLYYSLYLWQARKIEVFQFPIWWANYNSGYAQSCSLCLSASQCRLYLCCVSFALRQDFPSVLDFNVFPLSCIWCLKNHGSCHYTFLA